MLCVVAMVCGKAPVACAQIGGLFTTPQMPSPSPPPQPPPNTLTLEPGMKNIPSAPPAEKRNDRDSETAHGSENAMTNPALEETHATPATVKESASPPSTAEHQTTPPPDDSKTTPVSPPKSSNSRMPWFIIVMVIVASIAFRIGRRSKT
jgi:hypothetical protein